jgi:adenine deaminase
MPVGLLREGDPADYIIVDNLSHFQVQQTIIDGHVVAQNGRSLIPGLRSAHVNQFNCSPKRIEDFVVRQSEAGSLIRVIEALDGQLITNELHLNARVENGQIVSDPERDILKLVVVNRYQDTPPAVAFIKNFGLKHGAIASSVGHDSHNITAVGCDDESLCRAVNLVIEARGGLSATSGPVADRPHPRPSPAAQKILPLPVAGLMTEEDGYDVAAQYALLDQWAKQDLGSTLSAPFMTLSFMALLVIPSLKLSNMGLFDTNVFDFTPLRIVT